MRERVLYPKMVYGDYPPLGYVIVKTKEEHEALQTVEKAVEEVPVAKRTRRKKSELMFDLGE